MNWDKEVVREDRNLDFWRQYSASTLTAMCKQFGLPSSGDAASKAARLFVAWEAGYEPRYAVSFAETLKEDYRSQMKDADWRSIFTDPMEINIADWAQEPVSFTSVPSTFSLITILRYHDRFAITNVDDLRNFDNFLNSDAYKLFQAGHVKKLSSYDVPGEEMKLFRTRCAAEMTISDEKDVWFALNSISGEIFNGHCTCMAGMSGRCKHLFACLFKIEFIVRSGLNDPSVTDGDRQWGLPATKDVTAPQIVVDLEWNQDVFGKTPAYSLNSAEKREYCAAVNPMALDSLLDELKTIAPLVAVSRVLTSGEDQDALCIYLENMKKSNVNTEELLKILRLKYGGSDNRNRIESITRQHQATKETSENGEELWRLHRRLRVTASIAHRVYRKALELRTSFAGMTESEIAASTTTETLTRTLVDSMKGVQNFARLPRPIQWGKEKEETALTAYLEQTTLDKNCPNFKVERPGFIIDSYRPYYGATPDAIVGCECHGRRVVELKCPYTCNDDDKTKSPKPIKEAPFWCAIEKRTTGRLILKRTCPYYIQCMMQMALTGIFECDFYAWAPTGTGSGVQKEPEHIVFDLEFWENVESELRWFYEIVYLPYYLSS